MSFLFSFWLRLRHWHGYLQRTKCELWSSSQVLPAKPTQIPKQYSCNVLLTANINLEMTVAHTGLSSLPKLIYMTPHKKLQLEAPFTTCKRGTISVHLSCIRNNHMHIRKLSWESRENFIRNAEQNSKLSHWFCLAVSPKGWRERCLKSQAEEYRTPKKRSGPLGTNIFSPF